MKSFSLKGLLLAATVTVVAVAAAPAAQALPVPAINGTLGFVSFGPAFTGSISAPTSVTFGTVLVSTTTPDPYTPLGGSPAPNQFNTGEASPLASGAVITVSPNTFHLTTPTLNFLSFTSTNGDVFSFDLTSLALVASSSTSFSYDGRGMLHGTGFADTAAEITFGGSQAGNGASFSFQGTLSSPPVAPPPPQVPEPTTLALLGSALAGLGLVRRRG